MTDHKPLDYSGFQPDPLPEKKPILPGQVEVERVAFFGGPKWDHPKRLNVAYILLFFFGLLGVHRFYQGRVGTGLLWLFTLGLGGIGVLVDVFTLGDQIDKTNRKAYNS